MKILRVLLPVASLALLMLLAACERPHAPPPPTVAGSPAAPSTVSLSGSILDPQPNVAATRPVATRPTSTARRGATGAGSSAGSGRDAYPGNAVRRADGLVLDNEALREFQAEQEQRDRELLERDMDEAQTLSREQARARDRDAGREPYDLPPDDGDWTSADDDIPPDDGPIDEPPMDDRYSDPRDSGYGP